MSKRRDHYVQEAYLKRFANENGLLYKYSKSSSSYDKRLFSPGKVCKKNKYYSSRLETDILANFIEPKGLVGLDNILTGTRDETDFAHAYTYIEMQYYRVPANNSHFLDELLKRLCPDKKTYEKYTRRKNFSEKFLYDNVGCLKVAAEAQFSCPQFGPHAHRPISYLGTLLAFEVHATPDSSILAIMI